MKRVCVFCGSNAGIRAEYGVAAQGLAAVLARRGLELVYGGGNVGLMGLLADSMLEAGGKVIGVIPQSLVAKEVAHHGVTELRIVDTMHQRKALMNELSDAFIALPGGFGTLDEFFEILTWSQLGIHGKPSGLLNVSGYYDSLLAMLDHAVAEGLLRPAHRELVIADIDADSLLQHLMSFAPVQARKRANATGNFP
ncbi:MAG: TIGR00730 family Rossman fold protein [Betaproteobacteria bacterium]|nr:TIGR00730 family Rossman fold protein [Betaproteobacteria bacterium]